MKIESITRIKYDMSQFLEKLSQNLQNKGLALSSKKSALDSFMLISLALFPLLYMTLRSWTNSFVFILLILAIIYFINNPSAIKNNLYGKPSKWIIFTLSSAVLAIAISQSFRQDLSLTAFDGPSRILLTAIIFLYLKDRQINFTKILEWALPISLIICLGAYLLNPGASAMWGNRAASYFVDTITFGTYCLILGFICLISIRISSNQEHPILTILKVFGFLIGCYLAIKSQSRSAWTAAIGLLMYSVFVRFHKRSSYINWALISLGAIIIGLIYQFSPEVNQRVQGGIHEIITYFKNNNFDTSLGLRISMIRVAINLIIENPLSGLRDGVMPALNTMPSIQPFYTELLQSMITNTGTHTEILAQGVRSGIWGLISSISLFLVPGAIFSSRLSNQDPHIRCASILGLALVIGLFIASLTIQVFNLKYTSSFYALMIAALTAQTLRDQQPKAMNE
jgi:O-antigen ligase